MGFRMKTTLNIDDTVIADLKREAARQNDPYQSSAAAEHSSMLPTAMPYTTPWKGAGTRRRHQCADLRMRRVSKL
jgi:hypothetical protein